MLRFLKENFCLIIKCGPSLSVFGGMLLSGLFNLPVLMELDSVPLLLCGSLRLIVVVVPLLSHLRRYSARWWFFFLVGGGGELACPQQAALSGLLSFALSTSVHVGPSKTLKPALVHASVSSCITNPESPAKAMITGSLPSSDVLGSSSTFPLVFPLLVGASHANISDQERSAFSFSSPALADRLEPGLTKYWVNAHSATRLTSKKGGEKCFLFF